MLDNRMANVSNHRKCVYLSFITHKYSAYRREVKVTLKAPFDKPFGVIDRLLYFQAR